MKKRKQLWLVSLMFCGLLAATLPASAILSFYAPYDNNLTLTVGSPSTVSDSTGTVNIVSGFMVQGRPSNAGDFSGSANALAYGNVSSYFAGTTPNSVIGANTMRLLFKPNFSGPNVAVRHNLLGVGTLGATDSFYIYNSDDARGPAFLMTSITSGALFLNGLSNFNWNSSTWYYLGASFDNTGASFYVRPLLTNSVPSFQTASFGGSATWGGNMGSGQWTVQVGRRAPIFGAGPEGADGLIDDTQGFSNERWNLKQFESDFALVIPEPSTVGLVLSALALGVFRRKRLHRPHTKPEQVL